MKTLASLIFAFTLAILPATYASAQTVKSGNITGSQKVPVTKGSVKIVKSGSGHKLQLGSNFKTKKGPALYVYLGNGKPEKRIGKLQSISGAQSYSIPGSVNISEYSNVYIYCVPYRVVFGSGSVR